MSSGFDRLWVNGTREKIRGAKIVQTLLDHWEGKNELTASQIQVALKLLDRVLPKLRPIPLEAEEEPERNVRQMTREELEAEWRELAEEMRKNRSAQ